MDLFDGQPGLQPYQNANQGRWLVNGRRLVLQRDGALAFTDVALES